MSTLLFLVALAIGQPATEFKLLRAEAVQAGGAALDVEHQGRAAPWFGDFDGDGLPDLLVGEFFAGRLRIYKNLGALGAPRFDRYQVFLDGADTGRVPTG